MIAANVSVVELIWIGIGAAIAAINVWALVDARRDYADLEAAGRNGLLRIAGRSNVTRELKRTAVQLAFVGAGVAALYTPQPPEPYASSDARNLIVVALFAAQLANGLGALHDRHVRRRMLRYDARQRARDELGSGGDLRRHTDRQAG